MKLSHYTNSKESALSIIGSQEIEDREGAIEEIKAAL